MKVSLLAIKINREKIRRECAMDKSLLIVVIFLGVFSILKVIMFIAYSFVMKPKVDENGKVIEQGKTEKTEEETEEAHQKEDDDFWENW